MRLGLGSYACAWEIGVPGFFDGQSRMDAVGFIRQTADLGLRLAQIADNIPLQTIDRAELERIREASRTSGVQLELGTRGISPEHVRLYIELCRYLDCELLRVVVDTRAHEPSPDEVVDIVRTLVPELRKAGVTLAIENHDRFPARTYVDIVERIADPAVGICLDTVNSFGALEGPEIVVNTLAPHVVNLHVKDFKIRRMPHMMGFEITGVPAGEGQLNIGWLVSVLNKAGRDPSAILELWPSPEIDFDTMITKESGWRRKSVRNLRTWFTYDAATRPVRRGQTHWPHLPPASTGP